MHKGAGPPELAVPLHLFLAIDLDDPHCPVCSDLPIRYLPLYYPLKYGQGGGACQYSVVSDHSIQLLHMSDPADEEAQQYIRVPHLPAAKGNIIPLKYEEARILGFMAADGYFQPDDKDMAILEDLGDLIAIGGTQHLGPNAGDIICKNPQCEFFNRRVYIDVVATFPPMSINGSEDFWHEFQGGAVLFCFCLCRSCGTVIAFNIAD